MQQNIGNTPLSKSLELSELCLAEVLVKQEFGNPGKSAKDRPALYMIQNAIQNDKIRQGGKFVEASSGNTGLSVAMICKELGYQCKIFVSSSCSEEKLALLKSWDAEVVIKPNSNGPLDRDSTQFAAAQYVEDHPESYFTNQYYNDQNILSHYETTGPEIWKQTSGNLTHFIASVGTGGTISGVGRFLKEKNPEIKVIGVEPRNSIFQYYLEHGQMPGLALARHDSIEGIGRTFLPGTFDAAVVDQMYQVSEEQAREAALWFHEISGELSGFSSAAVVASLRHSSAKMGISEGSRVVVLFPDHGDRYQSKLYRTQVKEERR